MYVHSAGSPAEFNQRYCIRSAQRNCFKAKVECTLHCHGRDGGAQCTNTGASAAPSGNFNLKRNTRTAPPEPSCNEIRDRANTEEDACKRTDPTSAEDTADKSSDSTGLDTADWEVLEEDEATVEEVEEGEGNEKEENEEEGNEEDVTVSNDDMEHSVIVVAPGRPIVGITMMYRGFIIFDRHRERTGQFTEVGYGRPRTSQSVHGR